MKDKWYVALHRLDIENRFWNPSQFPRIFRDIYAIFPLAKFTFFHAHRLPWTIWGEPSILDIIDPGNTWDSSINYFQVTLDTEWGLHVWGSPRGKEGFRLCHLTATEKPLSPALWELGNLHFPLFKELLVRLRLGRRKDFTRVFNKKVFSLRYGGSLFIFLLLLQVFRYIAIDMWGNHLLYNAYNVVFLFVLFFLFYKAIKKTKAVYYSLFDPQEWHDFKDRSQL